jgi:polyhydroxybutyrate depolymerase
MTTPRFVFVTTLVLAVLAAACGSSEPHPSAATPTAVVQASAGCRSPDADFAALGDDGRFTSGGIERVFSIAAPEDVSGRDPLPLIVNLHGARATAVLQQTSSELSTRGPEEGFVVVAPQGMGTPPNWRIAAEGPDLAFVEQLIDEVERRMCIDQSRIYLTGFSMGGMMTMLLACRQPERYAAIAPVAGEIEITDCPSDRPPLLAFHGTADTVVHFDGTLDPNVAVLAPYPNDPPRDEIVRRWADANGCTLPATDTPLPPDVEEQAYTCPPSGSVEMYVIEGGGHTWPGSTPGPYAAALGGSTTQTIDATGLMLAFFAQHTRPA